MHWARKLILKKFSLVTLIMYLRLNINFILVGFRGVYNIFVIDDKLSQINNWINLISQEMLLSRLTYLKKARHLFQTKTLSLSFLTGLIDCSLGLVCYLRIHLPVSDTEQARKITFHQTSSHTTFVYYNTSKSFLELLCEILFSINLYC